MKKIKLILVAILATFAMTSCVGLASNMTANLNQNQTSVVLSQKNFHIVKTVSTEVTSKYILGLGGMRNLEKIAIADLTHKANLTGSQALLNVKTKESIALKFLIFQEISIYAEATVIEFDK